MNMEEINRLAGDWYVAEEEEVITTVNENQEPSSGHRQARQEEAMRRRVMAAEVQIPLGLRQDQVQPIDELAEEWPELKHSLTQLASGQLAASTLQNYNSAIGRFQDFCAEKGYSYTDLSEKIIIHYIADLNMKEVSYSIICQIRPAIKLLEEMHQGKTTVFTARADRFLDGAMRTAATRRQPVKKAGEASLAWLQDQVKTTVWDRLDRGDRVDGYKFRLLFRLTIEYYTLCRLSDYQKLRAKHLELIDGGLQITFPQAKNDQMHQGQVTVLSENDTQLCPVKLAKEYSRQLGMKLGAAAADGKHLCCRIRKNAARWSAEAGLPVSLSKARDELKKLLQASGLGDKGITDKSFKMLGVTSMMAAGISAEEVALHGRWKTPDMPLRYKHNSTAYKLSVAQRIPF